MGVDWVLKDTRIVLPGRPGLGHWEGHRGGGFTGRLEETEAGWKSEN